MESSSEDEILIITMAAAATIIDTEHKNKIRRKKRKIWSRNWLLQRSRFGVSNLLQEMKLNDLEGYKNEGSCLIL